MHIEEFSKPWNYDKVWFDHNEQQVVIKLKTGHILKFQDYCHVDIENPNTDCMFIKIYTDGPGVHNETIDSRLEIDDRCNGDFITGIRKAFNKLKPKSEFLCPSCKFGSLARTVKSAEGIPYDVEYMCVDMSKLKKDYKPMQAIDGFTQQVIATSTTPSLLDYESGPGGWDGTTCPNYVKYEKKEQEWTTITTNNGVIISEN